MSRSGGITWFVAVALSAALAGCGDERPPADAATPSGRSAATLVDSLVLTAPGGAEVWFTDGRAAQDSLGVACSERVLEIRTARDTVAVPLLYTGEAPTLENDSTLRARVWLDCQARALYHVNIRTGRPSRVEP
ncbi:MAG: hypothetical protein V3R97_01790 [Gemmatimonadales bacterium]